MSERNLVLCDEINKESVKKLIEEIQKINAEDDENDEKQKNYTRKPIKLIINSPGGECYVGFGLLGVIENSKTPVHTICYGHAMSMALAIFLAGHKRYAHCLATFMYHEISYGKWGKLTGHKHEMKEVEKLQNMYDNYILSKTKIKKEKLDSIKDKVKQWYIPANEAVELGIADEII